MLYLVRFVVSVGPENGLFLEQAEGVRLDDFGVLLRHLSLAVEDAAHLSLGPAQHGSGPPLAAYPLAEVLECVHGSFLHQMQPGASP